MNTLKEFWEEEDAFEIVEILLILAVVIVIVVIFRKAIVSWVTETVQKLFKDASDAANTTPTP